MRVWKTRYNEHWASVWEIIEIGQDWRSSTFNIQRQCEEIEDKLYRWEFGEVGMFVPCWIFITGTRRNPSKAFTNCSKCKYKMIHNHICVFTSKVIERRISSAACLRQLLEWYTKTRHRSSLKGSIRRTDEGKMLCPYNGALAHIRGKRNATYGGQEVHMLRKK